MATAAAQERSTGSGGAKEDSDDTVCSLFFVFPSWRAQPAQQIN
jgi:hypothetical protein